LPAACLRDLKLSLASADVIPIAMQLSAITRITPEQFLAWGSGQEERYELVDGEVVMMAGAGRRHDRIVVNLTTLVHTQIRGDRARPSRVPMS